MPSLDRTALLLSTLHRHTALPNTPAAQDADSASPEHVGNATRPPVVEAESPALALTQREADVRGRIRAAYPPESWKVAEIMDRHLAAASTPAEREAVTAYMEKALAARDHELNVVRDLGLNVLGTVLDRAAWSTLLAALPSWANSALTAGQVARAAFSGNWSSLAAVLPSLAAALPSLRSHAEFDALVQSLPESLRTGLASLHDSISDTDAQLRPSLAGGHLLSALAVATLLWQVQRALPSPGRQLQGIGRFIAELPSHWQRIAVLNGVGGALLEPAASAQGADLAAPKVALTPTQKRERIAHQKAMDRREAIVPPWDVANVAQSAWQAPGLPHPGGPAASPAARPQVGWIPWLGAGLTALGQWGRGGFQSVPQAPPAIEMTDMAAVPLREVTASTPLVPAPVGAGAAASATVRSAPGLRRGLLYGAVAGSLGGLGAAAWGMKHWLWPDRPATVTTTEVAGHLASDLVELPGGNWGTALDLVLGDIEPAARSIRARRAAPGSTAASSPPHRIDTPALHGVTAAQLDALRDDPELLQQLQSLRRWSVAMARDIATRPGWQWVARLSPTEQELLVGQWQALRGLRPALAAVQHSAAASMRAALDAAGWEGPWEDIEVRLPSVRVAGMRVDDRLPLLEYCLARDAQGTPVFLRGDVPVAADQLAQLTRFVRSADARRLRAHVNGRVEQLRPALGRALQARLTIDALKAKAHGVLGSGAAHRRGADVVLGFLQGTHAVERATLTYTDRLPDGTPVTVQVPNYLVLRSAGEPGLAGQVVLYRSDLASFQAFGDEGAFRQFLDTQRARIGMFAANGQLDGTLANDIVQAAAPAQRAAVRGLVQSWEARFSRFQSGDRTALGWNPGESFQLVFAPVDTPAGARQQWADALVVHGQALAQQQLDRNMLRWSPLGIANIEAENAYRLQQDIALQSLRQHAHGSVCESMVRALRRAGFQGSLQGFDPDRVRLRVGGQDMSLTDWATRGWQRYGLRRPAMPANLPDWSPDAGGMPEVRLDAASWLQDSELDAMQLVAYQPDARGTPDVDIALSAQLQDPLLRRALCVELEDFADSNALADDYIDHLQALPYSADGNAFAGALANQLRARTGWMIEVARQDSVIDAATHAALRSAHGRLDPSNARPSSLQAVTLKDHALVGLWAINSTAGRYVFLPDTAQGDRLLGERAFADWLREPGAEAYIRARAQYRHHPDLAELFTQSAASQAIPVGFEATQGPEAAAATLIAARIDDVDEMTVSQLERFAETFTLIGTVGVGALCSLASGGTAAMLCLAGTLGLVGRSIEEGIDQFERGDRDAALLAWGEAVFDGLDFAQIKGISDLLYQVGRRSLETVSEAADALRHWRMQSRAFAADGTLGTALVRSRATLEQAPMLSRPLPGGGTLYLQQGREYLQRNGEFVESYLDGNGVRRLRDPGNGNAAGAPVHFKDGQWRRMEARAGAPGRTTTPIPHPERPVPGWVKAIPEAGELPAARLDELEAIFGVLTLARKPTADVTNVVGDWTMRQRLQEIVTNPETLGRPGEGAVILRAWADSPRLGNGRSVETYYHEVGDWMRGARFGSGPVGLHVEVLDAQALPDVDGLVDAAGLAGVTERLGLPAQSPRDDVMLAVRRELAQVIAAKPAQSQLTWQRWRAMQHRLPTAADNLVKHYPELTRPEAQELTSADAELARAAESWLFPSTTATQVANVLANRKLREQRQSVVQGRIRTLSEVQVLLSHLQEVLPGREWSTRSAPSGSGTVLTFSASPSGAPAGQVTFAGELAGNAPADGARPLEGWQQRVFAQLAETEQQSVGDPERLRRAVIERMKQAKGAPDCAVPRRSGGRTARAADTCEAVTRSTLEPRDVETRDALDEDLIQLRATMDARFTERSALEREYNALWAKSQALKKQKLTLDDADAKRMSTLGRNDFGLLKGFDTMNFANYRLSDLSYRGQPVDLGPSFPPTGAAASGDPRSWMQGDGFVEPNYIRRVLIPNAVTDGKLTQTGMFPADYAMGADLSPVGGRLAAPGQASVEILLTEDDLLVHAPGTKGRDRNVRLADLSDADIERLGPNDLSATMKRVLGDARLLPRNARALVPAEPYRAYLVRSCSEDKIINNLFRSLGTAVTEIAAPLKGNGDTPIKALSGELSMLTEMHPCETSCNGRFRKMVALLSDMKINIFYRFDDNKQRREWWIEKKIERLVDRSRQDWASKGYTTAQMQAEAAEQLKDPVLADWVAADLARNPPAQPTPRLWDAHEEQAF
ncbi:hypothetical protein [uncultured Stenotrophomonas sp.]|uniref:hypothetical protein n=1 Tax=uncultured Stenotrophomonas sp. TaxID=165438 RepID=UPI0028E734F1|nr:hypothetical protein [uncultured Stenotrophomonas sp.]